MVNNLNCIVGVVVLRSLHSVVFMLLFSSVITWHWLRVYVADEDAYTVVLNNVYSYWLGHHQVASGL